jgi:hypothetical protein
MQEFVILETESPAFGGRSFGSVGQYERLSGYAVGTVDPADRRNAGIVNIDNAPRNADGLVQYRVDICLLRPVDPAKANGWLFYEVLNRGSKRAICRVNTAPATNESSEASDAGNGFLMEQGFTIVWSGWQHDLKEGNGRMRAEYPIPTIGGEPITGLTAHEVINESGAASFITELTYPAASVDRENGTLTARVRERDERERPAGLDWRYVDDRHIEITRPSDRALDAGTIFEFVYTAKDPVVTGLAFAAHRDIACFLRGTEPDGTGRPHPLAGAPPQHLMLFGLSQSGRLIRDFLYQGFNESLDGTRVFDAAVPVIAGSRKTHLNGAFAQPGRYQRQHEDHCFPGDQFPFAYRELSDPISARTDSVLARCEETGTTPKIMHLDTETEIWSARASLIVTDCEGRDIDQPEDVRVYLASGVPHGNPTEPNPAPMQMAHNELGYGALIRPLLVALCAWVEDGTPPPPSCFPSVASGTLVQPEEAGYPEIPPLTFTGRLNGLRRMDHSRVPPREGAAYPVLVSSVDADGNAVAGLRHPAQRVPRATLLGWNLRAAGYGEGDLYSSIGSLIPFAETQAERLAEGDPRPSIEERYASREQFAAQLRSVCDEMIATRLLLPEDAERMLAAALSGENVLTVA